MTNDTTLIQALKTVALVNENECGAFALNALEHKVFDELEARGLVKSFIYKSREDKAGYWLTDDGKTFLAMQTISDVFALTRTPNDTTTTTSADLLTDTARSARDLYARFGVGLTPDKARRMLREECGEACDASVFAEAAPPTVNQDIFINALAAEAADVIYCVIGLLLAHGAEDALPDALRAVIAKNDAKGWNSHRVDNGKITRREA